MNRRSAPVARTLWLKVSTRLHDHLGVSNNARPDATILGRWPARNGDATVGNRFRRHAYDVRRRSPRLAGRSLCRSLGLGFGRQASANQQAPGSRGERERRAPGHELGAAIAQPDDVQRLFFEGHGKILLGGDPAEFGRR